MAAAGTQFSRICTTTHLCVQEQIFAPSICPNAQADSARAKGFTRVDLLVVLALVFVLGAILEQGLAAGNPAIRGVRCLNNARHTAMAYFMYGEDNNSDMVALYLSRTAPPDAIFPGSVTWWVELLRPYLRTTNFMICPLLTNHFGLALNHPELSAYGSSNVPKIPNVKRPAESIPIADAGLIQNVLEQAPDKWLEAPGQENLYWRTPTNQGYYDSDPQRPIGRHNGVCTAGFVDGHAQLVTVSSIGLQFFPGKTTEGQVATGARWLGGNGLSDPRWKWDTE